MYNDQLIEQTLSIDDVYLDPNNPRFWSQETLRHVVDRKVPDLRNQERAMRAIESHGLEELLNSILRNGFLPLDRIVVRELQGISGKYVVVEGNRRLAALRRIRERIDEDVIEEEHITEEYLEQLKHNTDNLKILNYIGEETSDIAWLFQGIRHVSGIREWDPAQSGRLLVDRIDVHSLSYKSAGQQFGITPQKVARSYRAFKGLSQMTSDDEYGAKAKNSYFTLFEEATRNRVMKEWLEWDDGEYKFNNSSNLAQFYSWITPDEDQEENKRRLHDPKHVKKLAFLIAGHHESLIAQVDAHELGIEAAEIRAKQQGERQDWKQSIENAQSIINDIPQSAFQLHHDEIIAVLQALAQSIQNAIRMAKAVEDHTPES